MGCDIHPHVEVKTDNGWQEVKTIYRLNGSSEETKPQSIIIERNYALFGMLADVRNYDENEPISEPKSLPSDVSTEVAESFEAEWFHSSSYVTLKELYVYLNKHPTITRQGFMDKKQSDDLDKGISPTSWCEDTSRDDYVHRTWQEPNLEIQKLCFKLETILSGVDFPGLDPYSYWAHPEKIRLVFWFDN